MFFSKITIFLLLSLIACSFAQSNGTEPSSTQTAQVPMTTNNGPDVSTTREPPAPMTSGLDAAPMTTSVTPVSATTSTPSPVGATTSTPSPVGTTGFIPAAQTSGNTPQSMTTGVMESSSTSSTTGESGPVFISGTPAVRFVNVLEGVTIDIYSGQLDTVHLAYEQVSVYQPLVGGQIKVTNVVDSTTGESYTNGEPLLITFGFNATVAIVKGPTGSVVLALFNETLPDMIDSSKAYVRMLDFSTNSKQFVTLANTAGAIASYVGSMVCTSYKPITPEATSLRIFDSQSGTYNTPMINLPATLYAGDLYTVFYFTPASGPAAEVVLDRSLAGPVTPPLGSSTSGGIVQGTPTPVVVQPSSASALSATLVFVVLTIIITL